MTSKHFEADSPHVSDFRRDWERWHEDVESRRRRPYGFLAVTGIHWLTSTPTPLSDTPGQWFAGDEGPEVLLATARVCASATSPAKDESRFGDFDEQHPGERSLG